MRCIIVSGEGINQVYFPILVPIGVVGNVLSFLVRKSKKMFTNNKPDPHNMCKGVLIKEFTQTRQENFTNFRLSS